MTKSERIAYIAGIVDGEAYIGIKRSTYGMRKRADVKSPTYHERVQIRMRCGEILALIKDTFGGALGEEPKIYQSSTGFNGHYRMWCYRATDRVAARLIAAVSPFLIEKRRQAKAILALRRNKESKLGKRRTSASGRGMLPEVLALREQLYQDVLACHRRT